MLRKSRFLALSVVASAALTLGLAYGGSAPTEGASVQPRVPIAASPATADETARELVDKFMTLLKQKDANALEVFLSDAFIIQRADGSSAVKADYLGRLPLINSYSIQDLQAMQYGPVLTVRWSLVTDQVVEGRVYSGKPAPRLSTFIWADDEWTMTSHANFNVPVD